MVVEHCLKPFRCYPTSHSKELVPLDFSFLYDDLYIWEDYECKEEAYIDLVIYEEGYIFGTINYYLLILLIIPLIPFSYPQKIYFFTEMHTSGLYLCYF